ncbi:DNA damage and replication checkpoint protein [Aspergillus ochraceoroseus]|uniref:DNA damage and replication checkpoint protein n=1 Tax=Aspergillus ochraceoroseus TaxID=138278 RepID=A0A0F8UZL2_9EURO|nr:DNA damage and replication checkpoint protein [Aspergillus ochraceoroseus]
MPPDIVTAARAASQSSSAASQVTQIAAPLSRPGTADLMRSRSETVISRNSRRPRSRGSTAIPSGPDPAGPNVFGGNPEDIIMRFGQQLSHQVNGASLDPTLQDAHHAVIARAEDFPTHALHSHHLSHHSLQGIPSHGLPNVPIPQYQNMYDSGIENHLPEHLLDDNEGSEAGTKKKKGSSSSLANDNELRKLLRQYEGYSLKQMAAEVLKHEGAGGKAEKVKQVFAMIWLKENCRKSSGSVRRDRVYCCYAEKCGTERVSVLNPASFGKLVRIIFPNVQTRRLGVRGESKYHYVDLTVIEEKQQQPPQTNQQIPSHDNATTGSVDSRAGDVMQKSASVLSQPTADTALFPSPTTSFAPKVATTSTSYGCGCQISSGTDDSVITLDNVASHSGKLIHQMLQLPTTDSSSIDTDSLQLPDINDYLPANTDSKVAAALAALYRSHCISVIDSFRYCKERNLLRYFSAFHGTLTVPVQKLLTHPNLAPWIKECDWLMYQKMIAFVAPLTTQVVPKLVLDAFSSISQRLTSHIADTFKTQPVHVSLARLIPAHIFCNLLKHMLDVNQSANAAAAWLCHPDNRNQMWFDFKTLVDPKEMITKANIPSCAEQATEQILKHDVKALLTPVTDINPSTSQPFFTQPDTNESSQAHRYPVEPATGEDYNFPDRWVSFILNIPSIFPQHRTQCIIQRVDALWDCILRRLTLGGAQSFSAWWMTKVFFHEMMLWQAEKGGFMRYTPSTLQKVGLDFDQSGPSSLLLKPSTSIDNDGPSTTSESQHGNSLDQPQVEVETNLNHVENEKSTNMTENLTGFSAPNHDDSAIDLDDDSMLMTVGKYGDMMASDPADAEGDVVVI